MSTSSIIVPYLYRSDQYYTRLSCEICNGSYSNQETYFDTICSNCAIDNYYIIKNTSNIIDSCCMQISQSYSCRICSDHLPPESQKVQNFKNFISLKCLVHPDQNAEKISMKSLSLGCSSCRTYEETQPIKYSLIENKYKELACKYFKSFCYERKRHLITLNLTDMLKACRWMIQLDEGLFCVKHPFKLSKNIDNKMNTFCKACNKSQELGLEDIEQVSDMVIEIAREKAMKCKPNCFNRYMIKTVKFLNKPKISTQKELQILILETRDFLNEVDFGVVRCVLCCERILCGNKTGVKNSCSHIFCFKCYSTSMSTCPIDNQNIEPLEYYSNEFLTYPQCHGFHNFKKGTIYKLPCLHLSCEKHKDNEYCFTCGLNFSVLSNYKNIRRSKTSENLIDFFDIRCTSHPDAKIEYFSLKPTSLSCSKCCLWPDFPVKLQFPKSLLKTRVSLLEEIFKDIEILKDFEIISTGMLKVYTYLRVLSYQKIVNFYNILKARCGQICLESVEKVPLFDVIKKKVIRFLDYYKIKQESNLTFSLIVNEDMICSGVIINKLILSQTNRANSNITSRPVKIKCFKDKSRNVSVEEFEMISTKLESFDDWSECCFFQSSIYLKEAHVYDFHIPIPSGYHYWSKTFSKAKTHNILIGKIPTTNLSANDINGNFGGVLRGLLISSALKILDL